MELGKINIKKLIRFKLDCPHCSKPIEVEKTVDLGPSPQQAGSEFDKASDAIEKAFDQVGKAFDKVGESFDKVLGRKLRGKK